MTHARKQIRDAAVTLATGLTTTGANVFVNRLWELGPAQVPAWDVTTSEPTEAAEDVELISMGRAQARIVLLTFTGIVRELDGEAIVDKLDLMTEELETAITKAALVAVVAIKGLELLSTEFAYDVDETDQAHGRVTTTFAVTYYTTEGAPGALV